MWFVVNKYGSVQYSIVTLRMVATRCDNVMHTIGRNGVRYEMPSPRWVSGNDVSYKTRARPLMRVE